MYTLKCANTKAQLTMSPPPYKERASPSRSAAKLSKTTKSSTMALVALHAFERRLDENNRGAIGPCVRKRQTLEKFFGPPEREPDDADYQRVAKTGFNVSDYYNLGGQMPKFFEKVLMDSLRNHATDFLARFLPVERGNPGPTVRIRIINAQPARMGRVPTRGLAPLLTINTSSKEVSTVREELAIELSEEAMSMPDGARDVAIRIQQLLQSILCTLDYDGQVALLNEMGADRLFDILCQQDDEDFMGDDQDPYSALLDRYKLQAKFFGCIQKEDGFAKAMQDMEEVLMRTPGRSKLTDVVVPWEARVAVSRVKGQIAFFDNGIPGRLRPDAIEDEQKKFRTTLSYFEPIIDGGMKNNPCMRLRATGDFHDLECSPTQRGKEYKTFHRSVAVWDMKNECKQVLSFIELVKHSGFLCKRDGYDEGLVGQQDNNPQYAWHPVLGGALIGNALTWREIFQAAGMLGALKSVYAERIASDKEWKDRAKAEMRKIGGRHAQGGEQKEFWAEVEHKHGAYADEFVENVYCQFADEFPDEEVGHAVLRSYGGLVQGLNAAANGNAEIQQTLLSILFRIGYLYYLDRESFDRFEVGTPGHHAITLLVAIAKREARNGRDPVAPLRPLLEALENNEEVQFDGIVAYAKNLEKFPDRPFIEFKEEQKQAAQAGQAQRSGLEQFLDTPASDADVAMFLLENDLPFPFGVLAVRSERRFKTGAMVGASQTADEKIGLTVAAHTMQKWKSTGDGGIVISFSGHFASVVTNPNNVTGFPDALAKYKCGSGTQIYDLNNDEHLMDIRQGKWTKGDIVPILYLKRIKGMELISMTGQFHPDDGVDSDIHYDTAPAVVQTLNIVQPSVSPLSPNFFNAPEANRQTYLARGQSWKYNKETGSFDTEVCGISFTGRDGCDGWWGHKM